METDSTRGTMIEFQNGFDKSIQVFETFAREVFNGSNENEKTKLHKNLEEFMILSVLKRCKKLCEVDIYKCSYLMNFLSQTMKFSQGLKKLKLQSMSLSIKAFKNIEIWQGLQRLELIKMEIDYTTLLEVTKIKTLKSLKIRDCNYRYSTKGTKTTYIKHFSKALATNCNQFEELEIDDVDSIDLQEIATLKALKSFTFSHGSLDAKQIKVLANLHKLETITLNFQDKNYPKAASELNELFQKHMSSLKNIKIGRLESNQISTTFLDNLILCENLDTVSVHLSGFCNSDILKIFQLQSLKKLVLSGWYSLPREFRKNLATNDLLANLEEFEASCNVFRTSDSQIIFKLPKLKSLKLVDDPWVLSKTKRMVMNQMNCPLLERLFLPNFSSENPFNLDALRCLVKTFPKLKIIQFNGCIDEKLTHQHLYQVCKESGIIVVISKNIRQTDRPALARAFSNREAELVNLLTRRRFGCYYNNQEDLENSFLRIDSQFYSEYLHMKKEHEEWCLRNDWPLPGISF